MRKLLLLLLLLAVAAIAVLRQRLFLRDPLGKVLVGGASVEGARVFINYSNDVLLLREGKAPVIVQEWDRMPGHPEQFTCLRTLACLTSNDHAPKTALQGDRDNAATTMGDREVSYRDEAGELVRAVLR